MLSTPSPSRPEAQTNTRLRRMLQSIVGHVFAGGEVTTRQGAVSTLNSLLQDLQLSENITRTRVRKHQTSNSLVPRIHLYILVRKASAGLILS